VARDRPAPHHIEVPEVVAADRGAIPPLQELVSGPCSPDLPSGAERIAQDRLDTWLDAPAAGPWETSRLSPHLRFGCLSPVEVARQVLASGCEGAGDFVRQLCWRDVFHQVVAGFPAMTQLAMGCGNGQRPPSGPRAEPRHAGTALRP
jgi:deoxyribodipyrimidine photo-lyase